jgi:5-bromo-4-chloroindolyl phosphate hydrolysis protein
MKIYNISILVAVDDSETIETAQELSTGFEKFGRQFINTFTENVLLDFCEDPSTLNTEIPIELQLTENLIRTVDMPFKTSDSDTWWKKTQEVLDEECKKIDKQYKKLNPDKNENI